MARIRVTCKTPRPEGALKFAASIVDTEVDVIKDDGTEEHLEGVSFVRWEANQRDENLMVVHLNAADLELEGELGVDAKLARTPVVEPDESQYMRGRATALNGLLGHLLGDLGIYPDVMNEEQQAILALARGTYARRRIVAALRSVCERHGDNHWQDDADLELVIERRLGKVLDDAHFRMREIVDRWGSIEGEHHARWVIDQLLRAFMGDGYEAWVEERNADDDYAPWDVGIAP